MIPPTNAKIFKNLQEALDYSIYCPCCQSNHREITIEGFQAIQSFEINNNNNNNNIYLYFLDKKKYSKKKEQDGERKKIDSSYIEYQLEINCLTNKVYISPNYKMRDTLDLLIRGTCPCNFYFDSRISVNLDMKRNIVNEISLLREGFSERKNDTITHISACYIPGTILVSKKSFSSGISQMKEFSIKHLDFSNPSELVEQFETLLFFS